MVMVLSQIYQALKWWTVPEHVSKGRAFQQAVLTLTVTKDASILGWGSHSSIAGKTFLFSGLWSQQECHINILS